MSTDLDQVHLRMVAADPAPLGAEPPAEVMTADVLLDLIDERSGIMPTSTDTLEHLERFLQPPRPAWAFAGAFVLLLVAIGVVVSVARNDGNELADQPPQTTTLNPATTVAEPTVVTTTAASTTTAAPRTIPTDIAWDMVMPAGVDGIQFYDAISDGSRIVALGEAIADEANGVWSSNDGFNWEPLIGGEELQNGIPVVGPDGFGVLTIDDSTIEYGQHWARDAVRGGPGWIAVGGWELDGRVWISPDGESWEGIDQTTFVGTSLDGIVAGGPGYVAVGSFHGIPDGVQRAAVFVSQNGLDWQLIDVFTDQETHLGSVHVDPADGSLLAFGNRAVWRSRTGYDWTAVHHRDVVTWLSQPPPWADAVWVGDTIVAAGGDRAFSLWYSYDDGASWLRHDPEDPVFDIDVSIFSLIEHQGSLIAVGSCVSCTSNLNDDEIPLVDQEWGVIWVGTPQVGG